MPGIRPFVKNDIPQVAELVSKVLHERQGPAPQTLQAHLDELFLQNPWIDPGIPSYVFEDSQSKLLGFFGVVPRQMSLRGKKIRLAFGSNFVLDPGSRATMAALQLVKAFLKGPQDVSITDSANESSRQLLRSLGFRVSPIYSLRWGRPLKPSQYALAGASKLKKSRSISAFATAVRPFCAIVDSVATKLSLSPFKQLEPKTVGEEIDVNGLLRCLESIPSKTWLLPEYNEASLRWIFSFIRARGAYGKLRAIAVKNEESKLVGWYVYGMADGRMGEVLQIGSDSLSVGKVLNYLFHDAWKCGLIGLHGRFEPQFMEELTRRSCFFMRQGSWTLVHSNNPEYIEPLLTGNAFFSRLEGEGVLRFGQNSTEPG